jgi:anaerobic selenocysteine-containing dehydrogenase
VPQFVTVEDSMSMVHASRGPLKPASPQLQSETAIVCGLASAALSGKTDPALWQDYSNNYDHIRESISRVVPDCANYNERVRQPGGFRMPNEAGRRVWGTPSGKAEFHTGPVTAFTVAPGRFVLQTFRSHDQFNTTIYGLNDRYRGIGNGRRVIFMNPDDLKKQGLKPMQLVDITSYWSDGTRHADGFQAVPYEMPSGNCAAYYPEANVLVPLGSSAEGSGTPTSKSVEVSIVAATPRKSPA